MASSSSSSSPCAACKFLRRKCTSECVFAPYFPPDQPQKFASVHKIFGASNITKLLNELPQHQREDAVNSLAYEADARVKDPVYGCVGAISILQRHVAQLQKELAIARSDLARYAGGGIVQASSSTVAAQQVSVASPSLGIGMGLSGPTAREQILARQQLMELAREPVTREQILDYARAGGSYESLAAMGMTAPVATQIASYPHSRPRPGGDGGGSSSSAGGSGSPMGHFKIEPSP